MSAVSKRLAEIGRLVGRGEPYEKYEKEINRLLDVPEESARDEELEEKWEKEYREGRE